MYYITIKKIIIITAKYNKIHKRTAKHLFALYIDTYKTIFKSFKNTSRTIKGKLQKQHQQLITYQLKKNIFSLLRVLLQLKTVYLG